MSEDTSLTPRPADVAALVDEERALPGLPAGARERLRARIDLLAPLGGVGGGEGGGGGEGAGGSAGAGAAAASGGALKGAIASKIAIAAVAFGVGGASGAAVHATLAPTAAPAPALTVSAMAAPQPIASFAPPASASSSALSVDDLPNAAPKPSAKATPSAIDPSKDGLKQERVSLEVACTAITRGDYAGAIAALDRHAAAFPRGQLAEERELMRIQALVGQGRGPEAKARAAEFHRDFPHSLMKGAVDATVRSIP